MRASPKAESLRGAAHEGRRGAGPHLRAFSFRCNHMRPNARSTRNPVNYAELTGDNEPSIASPIQKKKKKVVASGTKKKKVAASQPHPS